MTGRIAAMPHRIRILIVDDHPIFRDGLRTLLDLEPDFEVVGEATDGHLAVRLTGELRPDIVLLDFAMPGLAGLDALQQIAAASTSARILLLTASIDRPQVVKALELGARGVILKESATQVLLRGIRGVMAGQCWVGRGVVSDLLDGIRRRASDPARRFGLTARELEIVAAIAAACSNKEIADRFGISDKTVKNHLTSIFDKLGVSSRLELALFAVDHDLAPSSAGGSPARVQRTRGT
jgi:DNA-binding NarL/FixJ family response regulator